MHAPVRRQIAVSDHRADAQAPFRGVLDLVQRETADIDDTGRRLDLELHQIEQDSFRPRSAWRQVGPSCRGLGERIGALIGEGLHVALPRLV